MPPERFDVLTGAFALVAVAVSTRGKPAAVPVLLGVVALLVLAAVIVSFADAAVFQRMANLGGDWADRTMMWRHYATIASRSPWFGYGLGSFSSINMAHLEDVRQASAMSSTNAAHNIVLQLILNGGVPYLALVSSALALLARHAVHGFVAAIGPAVALLVILCSAMIDIALDVPGMILFAGLLTGLVCVGFPQRAKLQQERHISG